MEQQTGVTLRDANDQLITSEAAQALIRFANEHNVSMPANRIGGTSAAASRILIGTVVDCMFSREPVCPACGAQRSCTVSYGMPTYDWAMNMPTWVTGGGCCVGSEGRWRCGACGHTWGTVEGPR